MGLNCHLLLLSLILPLPHLRRRFYVCACLHLDTCSISVSLTAVQVAVEEVHEHGGRVLIVAPTGRLAATYRAKYPHLEVDTIHGAFMV